jgi:histidyl-tRNA synthetase
MEELPDLKEAGPADAAKWRFVRRRTTGSFLAHGYREVQPAPIDPSGTSAEARGGPAIPLSGGGELRRDPLVSIARLFAREHGGARFSRWMTSGHAFEPAPLGPHVSRAWQMVSGLLLGAAEPAADAEIAGLAAMVANDLDLREPEVVLSSLGEPGDLAGFLEATTESRALVCAECRASTDFLRFLTCSDEGCRALAQAVPPLRGFLSVPALQHHEAVLATLEAAGIVVRDDPRLGFGAGRYDRTLIELRARDAEGRVLAVARGGRRDGIVEALGGPALPAIGLTVGIARSAACTPGEPDSYEVACELFIAARGAGARAWALKAAQAERSRGFRVDVDLREVSFDEQLARAAEVRARVIVVVGDAERKKGQIAIHTAGGREVRHIPEESLPAELKRLLR